MAKPSCIKLCFVMVLLWPLTGRAAEAPPGPAEPLSAPVPAPQTGGLKLHVPSPDWRDQVIYFVMTDRFDDGDPRNNDQGANEYDPQNGAKYSGGDLKGIERRLDYIKGLGATTVWITPPVANQWWDGITQYGGYHGYWAENFKAVDAHYGSLADYRQLSHALHSAGMYLIQDIVVNHTGNFFDVIPDKAGLAPTSKNLSASYRANPASFPVAAPSQWPFVLNDVRKPEDRAAAIYHWTPTIADVAKPEQEANFQLASLDDLNTENPTVRAALRDSYGFWIREVGVDGYRVDTAFYVPPAYFRDFLYADDAKQPGILTVAKQTGRQQFHVFGEGFGMDRAYTDSKARKIDRYMRSPDGQALLPGMINFPLYGSITDVFARGQPTAELAFRIRNMMQVHQQPHLMPSFVDNHDVDRFLAGGSLAGLRQSLLMIMTLPGIPTLYYGTEQAFKQPRSAMFANGVGAAGKDHFDRDAPLYRYIQQLTTLRRDYPLFSRGMPEIIAANAAAPGALAYRMNHQGQSALVVFNSADRDSLLDNLDTGLAAGTVLKGLLGIEQIPTEQVIADDGKLNLRLPARSGQVWLIVPPTSATKAKGSQSRSADVPQIDALAQRQFETDFAVSGTAADQHPLQLVIDGNLITAQTVSVGNDERWQAVIDTGSMIDPAVTHRVVAWQEATGMASAEQTFTVNRRWQLLTEYNDPIGDDYGPNQHYRYPTDPTWQNVRPLDIRAVRVFGSGGALKIDVQLSDLIATWSPTNGFDHLALTLFLQLPDANDGSRILPLQNAAPPEPMRWHYRLRVNGWSNALFSANGASAGSEGSNISPGASLRVDRAAKTLSVVIPAEAIGNKKSLAGATLYLTSWDYDGGFKALAPQASGHGFGGGNGQQDPLVMDDTALIRIPMAKP